PHHLPNYSFFSSRYLHLRALLSFPTRRSSDLGCRVGFFIRQIAKTRKGENAKKNLFALQLFRAFAIRIWPAGLIPDFLISTFYPDRKSTRLNSSHLGISYAVFCLKKKKKKIII